MRRRKILFLQKRLLFPTDSGGKIRTLNIIKHLARWHDITYLCNILPSEQPYIDSMNGIGLNLETIPWSESGRNTVAFYRDLALNIFSPYPFNVNKDFDPRLRARVLKLLQQENFDLVVCDFVQMARNCLGIKTLPKLLFEHNVEAQIFERHAKQGSGLLLRAYMWLQWKKMHQFERRAGRDFDLVVAVSDQDRASFENRYDWRHTRVIGTSVDTDYYFPEDVPVVPRRCTFVGSMDWLPNEQAVIYFVQRIWPLVRRRFSDATFQIVGRNPPRSIAVFDQQDGVSVTGNVPDVRPYLAGSEVVVIPLRVGGGTRLKVFESMAMGKPIVSTTLGVEGLPVENLTHLLLADDPETFAMQIGRLFDDQLLRRRLTEESLSFVRSKHGTETIAMQFNSICEEAINLGRGGSD
ncbi:MAG: glycosyltransferase [Planctomycetales bacterium]|nr:glycosyltransferase [Planctomycetales bacterium]